MRQFSILVIFAIAFGGAAVLYEKESRKVKGVLTQITDLQAKVGDMQAEINRLNAEIDAVKLAERRRPNLQAIASRALSNDRASATQVNPRSQVNGVVANRGGKALVASDVTTAPPAIRSHKEVVDDGEWGRPTVDAESYEQGISNESIVQPADPYQ